MTARLDNVNGYGRCGGCDDTGLALFEIDSVVGAPCPLCLEGERWQAVWQSKPRRYGPLPELPQEAVVIFPVAA